MAQGHRWTFGPFHMEGAPGGLGRGEQAIALGPQSLAIGLRRALTWPTSRRPGRCWRRWRDNTVGYYALRYTSPIYGPIVSPLHSCLRRLHIAPLGHLFNVGGKLWIIRQHVVEGVFVERVEVTVIDRTDTGSTGLAEE